MLDYTGSRSLQGSTALLLSVIGLINKIAWSDIVLHQGSQSVMVSPCRVRARFIKSTIHPAQNSWLAMKKRMRARKVKLNRPRKTPGRDANC